MKLGIAQIHTRAGDLAGTGERIVAQAHAAAQHGVDLLVFPLATLTGPAPVNALFQEEFAGAASRALAELAQRVACPCLVPVLLELDGATLTDAVLVSSGTVSLVRGEAMLAGAAHPGMTTFMLGTSQVGVAFSLDEAAAIAAAASADAPSPDVTVCFCDLEFSVDDPACVPGTGNGEEIATLAAATMSWVAAVASVGGYGGHVFAGASYLAAPDGSVATVAPAFEEALLVAEVGSAALGTYVSHLPNDERYFLWQALVTGVRDYVHALDRTDVALTVDGTVSSLALAVVASDALGPMHVHALPTGEGAGLAAARQLVGNLHIDPPVLPYDASAGADGLGVQPALAAVAREAGWLVLSADDKTGLALGGATPVVAGAFAPLADVLRTDVLAAAHVRNAISPVFPGLTPAVADVPACARGAGLPHETALTQVDNVIAAYLAADPSTPDLPLAPATLEALRTRMRTPGPILPFLVLSSCTLLEARLPVGFGWQPSFRVDEPPAFWDVAQSEPLDSEPVAEGRAGDAPDQRDAAPDMRAVQKAIRETFDLLRDISGNDAAANWPTPFSEN